MNILFVCRANMARSQMAEAFFNKASKLHKASSAGTIVEEFEGEPINPSVVKVMAEVGYDLNGARRRQLTSDLVEASDKVVFIHGNNHLPEYLKHSDKLILWDIEDPKAQPYEFLTQTRDIVKKHVDDLVAQLG